MGKPKFVYLLHEVIGVDEPRILSFLELLDPQGQGVVNYNDFVNLLNDPKQLKAEKDFSGGRKAGEDEMGFSQAGKQK